MKLLKKLTPKALIFWLMGDRAGNSLVAIWNWLWGIPIESGGKIAVESARGSLETMQKSLAELTESVAKVVAAHQSAQAQYDEKKQEHTNSLQQAITAQKKVYQEAARLSMVKVLSLEKILPAMKDRVDNAEKVVIAAKEKLRKEQEKFEHYKLEMSNLKAISSMNEALGKINDFDSSLNLNTSRDRFDNANEAIKNRYRQENAQVELSEDYSEKLAQEIDFLGLDDEINRRLAEFNQKN
jgi:phage shock protein A